MKIGIFTDTYWPQINGVVTSIQLLDQGLRRAGHEPYIFTLSHPDVAVDADPSHVFRVHSVRFYGQCDHRIGMIYSKAALRQAARLELDIIHSHAPFSLGVFGHITARKLRLPEVHTYHTMLEDYTHYVSKGRKVNNAARAVARRYSRFFCNWMTSVVVPTAKVKDTLLGYGVVRPIYILPTGVDLERFSPIPSTADQRQLRLRLGLPTDKFITLFVGRLAKEKSINALLHYHAQALKNAPNVVLLIVGDGDERQNLEQQSVQLGIADSVIFAGLRSGTELSQYYQAADLFVTASTSETQGLVVLEAMASGLPVLAVDDAAYRNLVVPGQTGSLFNNFREYEVELEKFRQPGHIGLFRNPLSATAFRYSAEGFSKSMLSIYQEALVAGPAAIPSTRNRLRQRLRRRFYSE